MITHLRDEYRGFLISTDIRRDHGRRYRVTHQQFETMRQIATRPVKLECDPTHSYESVTAAFEAYRNTARTKIDLLAILGQGGGIC